MSGDDQQQQQQHSESIGLGGLELSGAARSVYSPPVIEAKQIKSDQFDVIVRQFTVEDYEEVFNELLSLVSRCSSSKPFHSRETIEIFLRNPTYHPFVVRSSSDGSLVAFLEIYRHIHLGRTFDAELHRVVVAPAYRGKKIAQSVCGWVLEVMKNQLYCGRIDLMVEKDDARKVYTNLGFKPVETDLMRKMFIDL